MTTTEKVAYLKGLAEGLGIDDSTKEGRVLKEIINVLDDMALSVADLESDYIELSGQVDEIDEDLGALEEDFYDLDDDDSTCDCCDDEEFDDEEIYEVKCPTCGEEICIDAGMLDEGKMTCPSCGELLEFDFDPEQEEGCADSCDCKE